MVDRRQAIIDKIMLRVRIEPDSGCYIWLGPTSGEGTAAGRGYPRMHLDGQTVAVHRVMWVCKHGYLPGKKQLDHKRHEGCISKLCVNDEHLEPVTNSKNQRRRKEHLQRVAEIDQNNEAVINLGEISDEEAAILDAFTSSYGT